MATIGWPQGPIPMPAARRPCPARAAATAPFAPAPRFLLGPGPLGAALPVHRLHQVRIGRLHPWRRVPLVSGPLAGGQRVPACFLP
jgi:hypothetical protein